MKSPKGVTIGPQGGMQYETIQAHPDSGADPGAGHGPDGLHERRHPEPADIPHGDGVNHPTASASPIIMGDNGSNAGNTSSASDGALNPFDWANGAAQIEKAIAGISEIADSRVVVTNSTALVGVKFDNVYKGKLTERIREMVAAEVLRADPSIQTVAVTSEEADVQKVYQLSDQIRAGRTADELAPEINAIVRNATTLR